MIIVRRKGPSFDRAIIVRRKGLVSSQAGHVHRCKGPGTGRVKVIIVHHRGRGKAASVNRRIAIQAADNRHHYRSADEHQRISLTAAARIYAFRFGGSNKVAGGEAVRKLARDDQARVVAAEEVQAQVNVQAAPGVAGKANAKGTTLRP